LILLLLLLGLLKRLRRNFTIPLFNCPAAPAGVIKKRLRKNQQSSTFDFVLLLLLLLLGLLNT
jgi:hypothetical protein